MPYAALQARCGHRLYGDGHFGVRALGPRPDRRLHPLCGQRGQRTAGGQQRVGVPVDHAPRPAALHRGADLRHDAARGEPNGPRNGRQRDRGAAESAAELRIHLRKMGMPAPWRARRSPCDGRFPVCGDADRGGLGVSVRRAVHSPLVAPPADSRRAAQEHGRQNGAAAHQRDDLCGQLCRHCAVPVDARACRHRRVQHHDQYHAAVQRDPVCARRVAGHRGRQSARCGPV